MSLAPLNQQDNLIAQVRQACGAGMHMVNGGCVTTPAAAKSAAMSSADIALVEGGRGGDLAVSA